MTDDGRTIYGFIEGGEPHSFGAIGIGGTEVYTLPLENISALISRHSKTGFDDLPKETLLRNLTVYQSVIEQVMTKHPVIPSNSERFSIKKRRSCASWSGERIGF